MPESVRPTVKRTTICCLLHDFLAVARDRDNIEAAIVVSFAPLDAELVQTMRDRWNWRVAVPSTLEAGSLALADLVIEFDVDEPESLEANRVALPPKLAWPSRWGVLNRHFRTLWPRASVVVLTHDNLAFSRMCVASILKKTEHPNYELIIVDNASQDGTRQEMEDSPNGAQCAGHRQRPQRGLWPRTRASAATGDLASRGRTMTRWFPRGG